MIKIVRGSEPEFLRSEKVNAAKKKLYRSFENSARQERFHFDISILGQIKPDLMEMCHGKCAYCESRLDTVGYAGWDAFSATSSLVIMTAGGKRRPGE